MSHKWWHPFKSDEEKRLEVINDEIEQHERMIAKDKSGAVLEALKGPLEKLQKEKAELKVKNPDSKFIQENLVSNPDSDGGIFSGGEGENILNSIKSAATNAALKEFSVPGIINYDTIGSATDSFQEGGVEGAAEYAKGLAVDALRNGLFQKGISIATKANIPIATIFALANNPITEGFVKPPLENLARMASDIDNFILRGGGKKILDFNPLDFFQNQKNQDPFERKGIFENRQKIVPVYTGRGGGADVMPIGTQDPFQQPSVIDKYIASLNNPAVDDIQIQPLPVQINRPTMADVSGPSSSNGTSSYSPQDRNIQPARAPAQPENNPYSRFGRFGRANGGLVSMARVLKR